MWILLGDVDSCSCEKGISGTGDTSDVGGGAPSSFLFFS